MAHRGVSAAAPENSLPAFEAAIALGCDEVETDAWRTDDGRFVITHDPPLAGATALDLDTVLDLCKGRIGVNVELKSEGDEDRARRTGIAVARRIAERGDDAVYVSSFWWSALEGARDAAPRVRRAFVFSDSPDREALITSARALGLWALHPNRAYVSRELVAAAHRASLRVNVWTVNDPDEIAAFAALGVDGIMSDRPELVPKG